ncbi:transglycosylase domain-containing protein [Paenibacillus thiaminolyticus]|uniref:Penicillin-binding protein n=1 Tax=Paenibacillus thiaminolyticus TaxID=49283 RepID=A0A3A3GDV0_PANTH|nr:biosynthetic peptidoglycan transglycosylase [Paenibacillus thiaminolyticus]RJG21775.1 penicillin-binding protein [Paenibacillus thiaminolyticus]
MKIIRWEQGSIALRSPIRAMRAHEGEWTGSPGGDAASASEERPDKQEQVQIDKESTSTSIVRSIAHVWKRWVIYGLIAAILAPVIGWFMMAGLAPSWMNEATLGALREEIREGVAADGRHIVRLKDMPAYVTEALLAIEDHRYRYHPGIDPIGLARSVWINVTKQQKAQGGSTITMQLARNLFLTQDKLYSRKLKEMAIAANLEWRYTKDEILEMYFNKVYFGHGKYGIEDAARFYFGKTAGASDTLETINEAEAAMLAGLLKAPERLSPRKHPADAERRQNVVLRRMVELGWMTVGERQHLKKAEIVHPS